MLRIAFARRLMRALGIMRGDMPIGEAIACRELEFTNATGKQSVMVELGKPIQESDGPWFCPYLIESVGFKRHFRMAGQDSMQALVHAMDALVVELEVLAKNHNGVFTWYGDANLGFIVDRKS